eukprot:3630701-Rhodomonas_salina.1
MKPRVQSSRLRSGLSRRCASCWSRADFRSRPACVGTRGSTARRGRASRPRSSRRTSACPRSSSSASRLSLPSETSVKAR